jgi:hypothetical protein
MSPVLAGSSKGSGSDHVDNSAAQMLRPLSQELSMATVTVDLDDLEALIFHTGTLKTIEGALMSRRNDPFVRPHLDITPSHNRLAAEVRNAKRAESGTATKWDEPATREEQNLLRCFEDKNGRLASVIHINAVRRNPAAGEDYTPAIDTLASKGMIVIGQVLTGVLWAGDDRPEFKIDPSAWALKITPRGMAEHGRMKGAKR